VVGAGGRRRRQLSHPHLPRLAMGCGVDVARMFILSIDTVCSPLGGAAPASAQTQPRERFGQALPKVLLKVPACLAPVPHCGNQFDAAYGSGVTTLPDELAVLAVLLVLLSSSAHVSTPLPS